MDIFNSNEEKEETSRSIAKDIIYSDGTMKEKVLMIERTIKNPSTPLDIEFMTVVYRCIDCNIDGAGRDLDYPKDYKIPEVSNVECPVCNKSTLRLAKEATKKYYGHDV